MYCDQHNVDIVLKLSNKIMSHIIPYVPVGDLLVYKPILGNTSQDLTKISHEQFFFTPCTPKFITLSFKMGYGITVSIIIIKLRGFEPRWQVDIWEHTQSL